MSRDHRSRPGSSREGFTLLEMIISLVVLGVVLAVVGLPGTGTSGERAEPDSRRLLAARRLAIESGRPVRLRVTAQDAVDSSRTWLVITALPDGTVLAPASLGLDRFSGRGAHGPIP